MRNIIIDSTALSDQYKSRGIGTYAKNIIKYLVKRTDFNWHVIGFSDIEKQFSGKNVNFYSLGNPRLSNPANVFFFRNKIVPLVQSIRPELYFAPHFERGLPIGICKVAVMMHDVSPLIFSSYSSKGRLINFLKGIFYKYNIGKAKKADIILTNSNYTKNDLVKYGFDEAKIVVTYLALSDEFDLSVLSTVKDRTGVLRRYNIKKPYLFYYGGLEENKNTHNLLKVLALLRKSREIQLVLLDKGLYREDGKVVALTSNAMLIKKQAETLNLIDSLILPKYISWEDLPIIHAEAKAFVHLSSYEGFGLAVLEAMAAGSPVIAANRSCYPEVLGNAAILVDPDDIDEVKNAVQKLDENEFRYNIIQKGKSRSERYNWQSCADLTLKAFKDLLTKK